MSIEQTILILKPGINYAMALSDIYESCKFKDLQVVKAEPYLWKGQKVRDFYRDIIDKPYFTQVYQYLADRLVIVLLVRGPSAIAEVRTMVGETRVWAKGTLRDRYGQDLTKNGFHCSRAEDITRERAFFSQIL